MESTAPPTTSLTPSGRPTWLSLLLGSAVWFLHLNLAFGLASLACKWGWLTHSLAGIPALSLVEAGLTLAAAAALIILIYLPVRDWRRYQSEMPGRNPHLLDDTEKDRRPLVAFVTGGLNSLFLLFVLGMFVLVAALRPCAQA